jgi:hypothetical protein
VEEDKGVSNMNKIGKEIFKKIRELLEMKWTYGLGYKNLNGAWVEVKKLRLKKVGERKYLASGVLTYGIDDEDGSEHYRENFKHLQVVLG